MREHVDLDDEAPALAAPVDLPAAHRQTSAVKHLVAREAETLAEVQEAVLFVRMEMEQTMRAAVAHAVDKALSEAACEKERAVQAARDEAQQRCAADVARLQAQAV